MKLVLITFLFTISFGLLGQVPGQVTDSVSCQKNPNHLYAIYLPSNYSNQEKWPIVYFFEPAARGSLPVKLYKDVAEELGYILVCTYDSQNGQYDGSFKAADELFLETENRYSIDFDKVVFSGFSGGSRLALTLAVISKAAYAVIGVGAGQPPTPAYMVNEKKDFKYVGLVGARDMNYLEHKMLNEHLNTLNMDNLLLISNLTHTWAEPNDFKMALLWMQEDFTEFQEAISLKIEAQKDSIPLSDVISLRQLIGDESVDLNSKFIKKQLKEENKFFKKELQMKSAITDSMNAAFLVETLDNSSIDWVIRKVQKLKNQREKSENLSEQMMIDRLLNYVGAICFESGLRMKNQGFFQKTFVAIAIWEAVYENAVFANWFKARVYAAKKDATEALNHLEAAIKSGKVRKESVFREPDFEVLKKDPRFKELIATYYK